MNKNGQYTTLKFPHTVEVHPQSSLFVAPNTDASVPIEYKSRRNESIVRPDLVIYAELVLTTKEYMRNLIEIAPEWLAAAAPHFFKAEDLVPNTRKPRAKRS